jgi:hypothetical protein
MILEVCWDGLWTLSFGLSQFHRHGSRLVCEVALSISVVKHQHNSIWKSDLSSLSYGYHRCLFVDFLIEYIGPLGFVHNRVLGS